MMAEMAEEHFLGKLADDRPPPPLPPPTGSVVTEGITDKKY